jgi:hypothetical protein
MVGIDVAAVIIEESKCVPDLGAEVRKKVMRFKDSRWGLREAIARK